MLVGLFGSSGAVLPGRSRQSRFAAAGPSADRLLTMLGSDWLDPSCLSGLMWDHAVFQGRKFQSHPGVPPVRLIEPACLLAFESLTPLPAPPSLACPPPLHPPLACWLALTRRLLACSLSLACYPPRSPLPLRASLLPSPIGPVPLFPGLFLRYPAAPWSRCWLAGAGAGAAGPPEPTGRPASYSLLLHHIIITHSTPSHRLPLFPG